MYGCTVSVTALVSRFCPIFLALLVAELLDNVGGAQVAAGVARGLLHVGEAGSVAGVAADTVDGVAQRAGGDLRGVVATVGYRGRSRSP